ncbi:MAG: hypothetical protein ACI89T_002507, partial [Cognaticolwellia sp.]
EYRDQKVRFNLTLQSVNYRFQLLLLAKKQVWENDHLPLLGELEY